LIGTRKIEDAVDEAKKYVVVFVRPPRGLRGTGTRSKSPLARRRRLRESTRCRGETGAASRKTPPWKVERAAAE
jgi:hypothetical protein